VTIVDLLGQRLRLVENGDGLLQSSASGMPSSWRQMPAICGALSALTSKLGAAACARSRNSRDEA
jgi:hypothetical protein